MKLGLSANRSRYSEASVSYPLNPDAEAALSTTGGSGFDFRLAFGAFKLRKDSDVDPEPAAARWWL